MLDFVWDIYQQGKIGEAQATSEHALNKAKMVSADVVSVERRMDRLTLLCCAMWELLRQNTDLTDADLARKMREIDLRDGLADGKIGPAAVTCAHCSRTISTQDATCIYCGKDNPRRAKISLP